MYDSATVFQAIVDDCIKRVSSEGGWLPQIIWLNEEYGVNIAHDVYSLATPPHCWRLKILGCSPHTHFPSLHKAKRNYDIIKRTVASKVFHYC